MKQLGKYISFALIGLIFGPFSLLLSYIGIYFISGEEVYISEISQLSNIIVLIMQMFLSAMAWYFIFLQISLVIYFSIKYKKVSTTEKTKKMILLMFIITFFIFIAFQLLTNTTFFSINISLLNCIIFSVSLFIIGLISMIISIKQSREKK